MSLEEADRLAREFWRDRCSLELGQLTLSRLTPKEDSLAPSWQEHDGWFINYRLDQVHAPLIPDLAIKSFFVDTVTHEVSLLPYL
jgi:hypothetical protein